MSEILITELVSRREEIKSYIKDSYNLIETRESLTTPYDIIGDSITPIEDKSIDSILNFITNIILSLLSINLNNVETIYDFVKRQNNFTLYSFATGKGFFEVCLLYVIKKININMNFILLCKEVDTNIKDFEILKSRLLNLNLLDLDNFSYGSLPIVNNNPDRKINLIMMIHMNVGINDILDVFQFFYFFFLRFCFLFFL